MKNIFLILQIIISVALGALILVQSRGTGLGSAFGGGGESYRSKRGVEKVFFILTIVLAVLFFITSIANIIL